MEWDTQTREKFNLAISRLPHFHRHIAESAVSKRAEENARLRNTQVVQEEDVISAFFSDVPTPFYSMMVRLLEQTGFDYKKHGFPKTQMSQDQKNRLAQMRIAVIGAGAIGSLVSGYLKHAGQDVTLIGRPDSVEAIKKNGLIISGVRRDFKINIDAREALGGKVDLIILAVKTQDIENVIKDNLKFLKDGLILTTQNGVQADNLVAKYILQENIISSIVMFGATYLKPGEVVHNFEGNWIIGRIFGHNDEIVAKIKDALNKIFPTLISDDIQGMKYLKVFVNANNCIAAILGKSIQEAFRNIEVSRISIAIWKEGLDIVNNSGIRLVSLPDFPLERLMKLTAMPQDEAAKIFSGIMTNLSKEPLYGSILQSIKRSRPSEIDYINGEFVRLAKQNNLTAPINEKLVEMVHQVEHKKQFFSKEELLNNVGQLITHNL